MSKVKICLLLGAALFPNIAQAKMEVKLCTGKENDPYHVAGTYIEQRAKKNPHIAIKVVKDTGGTWANIQRTVQIPQEAKESCQAMIGQPDGPAYLKRSDAGASKDLRKVAELHREYLHVLCSKESGVDELEDLESDPKAYSLALGDDGSGAWLLWQNIIHEDEDYAPVPTKSESGALALSGVATNDTTCMLVPAGLYSQTVQDADNQYGDSLVLAEAQDKDFNDAEDLDGEALYEWGTIPGDTYENALQAGWGGAVDTISWRASVYVNTAAFEGNDKALTAFVETIARARASILADFDG